MQAKTPRQGAEDHELKLPSVPTPSGLVRASTDARSTDHGSGARATVVVSPIVQRLGELQSKTHSRPTWILALLLATALAGPFLPWREFAGDMESPLQSDVAHAMRTSPRTRDAVTLTPTANLVKSPGPAESAIEPLRDALADYQKSLRALQSGRHDVALSRDYYCCLAKLGELTFGADNYSEASAQDRLRAVDAIAELYFDRELFKLASSAFPGWLTWPARTTRGVVIAGKVESVRSEGTSSLVMVRARDQRGTLMPVVTDDLATQLVGRDVVFVATVALGSTKGKTTAPAQLRGIFIQHPFIPMAESGFRARFLIP